MKYGRLVASKYLTPTGWSDPSRSLACCAGGGIGRRRCIGQKGAGIYELTMIDGPANGLRPRETGHSGKCVC
jgi:hypothetical protein